MFKYENAVATNAKILAPVERVVEFSPSGAESGNVVKVLSLAVEGKVLSAVVNDGYVEVEGRADFKLLYLDLEGAPQGVDYNADFVVRIEGDCNADDSVLAKVDVMEADVKLSDNLTLSAVLEIGATLTERSEWNVLVDADECYKTLDSVLVKSFIAAKSVVIPISDELQAGDVERVLLLDSRAIIKNAEVGDGAVNVSAAVLATVTYVESGQLKIAEFSIPVEEEISIEGARIGDKASAEAAIRNARVVLSGVTGANVIGVETDLNLKVQVFSSNEIPAIKDLFMLKNEVELRRQRDRLYNFYDAKFYSEKVSGTATLADNKAAAREIVAIPSSSSYIAKAAVTESGAALVEGIVTADIVYLDENGLNSVRTEIPFSLELGSGYEGDIRVRSAVEYVTARVKRDREIEVTASLLIHVAEFRVFEVEFVSEVIVGEAKPINTSGLSLYIAEDGDGMWEVCKALTATPEAILEQNPTLVAPLKRGEKVVYFRTLSL